MASISRESSESISEESLSCSIYTTPSKDSEIEVSTNPDSGIIQPYMYKPVASLSESDRTEDEKSNDEEWRDNTDWYGHAVLNFHCFSKVINI